MSKGRPTPSQSVTGWKGCRLPGRLCQARVRAASGPVCGETIHGKEGWTEAWLNNYQVLPLEGDVSKQSLSPPGTLLPGVWVLAWDSKFMQLPSRAFGNREAASEILRNMDILSFKQQNNCIYRILHSIRYTTSVLLDLGWRLESFKS